jgi:hypothetical protein
MTKNTEPNMDRAPNHFNIYSITKSGHEGENKIPKNTFRRDTKTETTDMLKINMDSYHNGYSD